MKIHQDSGLNNHYYNLLSCEYDITQVLAYLQKHGIYGDYSFTQKETSTILGLSRSRVSQIEQSIQIKLSLYEKQYLTKHCTLEDEHIKSIHPKALFAYDKYSNILDYLESIITTEKSRLEVTNLLKEFLSKDETENKLDSIKKSRKFIKKLQQFRFLKIDSKDMVSFTNQLELVKLLTENIKHLLYGYFNKLLIPIENKHLYIIEEIINHKNNEISLTTKHLQKINYLAYSLYQLKENDITTSNYKDKVLSYLKLKEKALDNFGLKLPESLPFENPNKILIKIDEILYKAELSESQRNLFRELFIERKKAPDQNYINHYNMLKLQDQYNMLDNIQKALILNIDDSRDMTNLLNIDGVNFINKLMQYTDITSFKEFIKTNPDMLDMQTAIVNEDAINELRDKKYSYENMIERNYHKLFMNPKNIEIELLDI